VKDSIRIAFYELGQIHYKYGYVTPSVFSFMKSFDFSQAPDDQFNTSSMVSLACYEVQNF
jgi:hypothetical protein